MSSNLKPSVILKSWQQSPSFVAVSFEFVRRKFPLDEFDEDLYIEEVVNNFNKNKETILKLLLPSKQQEEKN